MKHKIPHDGSRDRRIEDPTNLWIVHPLARAVLPLALRLGISANVISVIGLLIGVGAAFAYSNWADPLWATLGLVLCFCWLIADGLDGMVARATGTSSPLGRVLDGICDHGVFLLLYMSLAHAVGTRTGWILALSAGAFHAVQSSLFEGERARFHRRVRGDIRQSGSSVHRSPIVKSYDAIAASLDRLAMRFDAVQARSPDPVSLGAAYGVAAAPVMRLMTLLSANMRVILIYLACLSGDPQTYWWVELVPLSAIGIATMAWHRKIERRIVEGPPPFGAQRDAIRTQSSE